MFIMSTGHRVQVVLDIVRYNINSTSTLSEGRTPLFSMVATALVVIYIFGKPTLLNSDFYL